MTVLVAYGSVGGSTGEIARWIADELTVAGLDAQVRPAAEVQDITGYEAIVLGGAVYAAGWHLDARAFAQRFTGSVDHCPVWLFSSGPLDDSPDHAAVPPNPQARAAMAALRARGHATFGGRLTDDARGWLGVVARRIVQEGHGGDFRNPDRIRAWARRIAMELRPDPR